MWQPAIVRASVPYMNAPFTPTQAQLATWEVSWQDLHAHGPCPRCEDEMPFDWQLDFVAAGTGGERSVTRPVTCACEETHPGAPDGSQGCGALWVAQFYEDATGGHAAPQKDPRLSAAAHALAAEGQDARSRLRTAAEKWVAGVAAVLALFSIAGTVAGGSILSTVRDDSRGIIVGLTVAAVAVAVVAVVLSYRAAYGWPKVLEMTDVELLAWHQARGTRLRTIARQLRWAVVAAVVSIGLVTSAAAIGWLNPSTSPSTTLKVTDQDETVACGTLLDAKKQNTVRLRLTNGSVEDVPLGTAAKVESVKSC